MHATVQRGQDEADHAQAAEERREMRWSESDDDEWADDRPDSVPTVTDAQAMGATFQCGAGEECGSARTDPGVSESFAGAPGKVIGPSPG